MRKVTALIVILTGLTLIIHGNAPRYAAGKRTEYCWPFCAEQGPKPNGTQGQPCQACVVSSPIDWAPINARMKELLATREPAHVGGIME